MIPTTWQRAWLRAGVVCRGGYPLLVACVILALPSSHAAAAFSFQRIVNSFTTTPPSEPPTATYDYVGIPAMSGGSVVFGAKTLGPAIGGGGLYDRIEVGTTGGALTNYAKRVVSPGPNPPVGTIAFFFDDPAISGNQIAARPSAYDGTSYKAPIFTYVAPNAPTTLGVAWGAPSLFSGSVAYAANKVGVNVTQLQNTFVDASDAVPGGGGALFQSFTPYGGPFDSHIDYNINYAVFLAKWIDASNVSRVGVYRWQKSTDTIVAVADKNVSIPGFPADKFDDNFAFLNTYFDNVSTTGVVQSARPSLAGSTVLYSYNEQFSTPARAGVYRYVNGSLAKVADVTTPNPSAPGFNFRHFEGVSTLGSAHAFVANSVVNNNAAIPSGAQAASIGGGYGIYLDTCGMISEVTRQGNILDGRVISNLEIGNRALTTVKFKYNLAFRAEFTDGTEGIYVASTSSLCYDPIPVLADYGNLFSASLVQLPADPGIGVPIDATWQTRVQQGAAANPATFGVDFEAGLIGVNGLPGNNPNLIDFTLDSGAVAPEELALAFSEDLALEGLRLDEFDELDSLRLTIGGLTRTVTFADLHDGMLPLADAILAKGETIGIAWDSANSLGDGFSFNGLGYRVVPEPASWLLASGCIAAISGLPWRTRRPRA
ncbi:hypothetical protein [Lacipirellula limnantheis]|uniref:Uncharacterized protein n=1 Tax=Lacipirellula limnantheis TaxID=2528024 RepID=A0A517U018_9BACT|nr:hypothetical protein [Lacipirellula limnantheis]QDT73974.1 hypothetical protein I41_31660 [Lacipirellula limnantheis]